MEKNTFQGRVVDDWGEPLEGAHVYFPKLTFNGVPLGTTTNANGDFSISNDIIQSNTSVEISYTGKEILKDTVANLNYKSIVLEMQYLPGYTGIYKKKPCWLCLLTVATVFAISVRQNQPQK
ncbi:carboxypeptidase-like regulatory domain-containing protein [Flavobacterium sp. J27]|uniref:carboxypeptidase-like regulatory domain-containing protein n=1 Tax=Flavobacterium sp. J27 TaxID=2060419 RepID=UPI00102F41E5|nr:carboxypeptidase-like regulatory domain-containing protein [Flavobacterium sp. J27]